jgi:hypothetical protein
MKLNEALKSALLTYEAFDIIENIIDEDYPTSFNIEEFKTLKSFNARIKYCEEHLKRISSGSSRIVYMIDDEKVLKLAKNKKGIAQNEVEISYGGDYTLDGIVAEVYESDENALWLEMQLAKKITPISFKQITGWNFNDYANIIYNYGIESGNAGRYASKKSVPDELTEKAWEDDFTRGIFDYIGNYGVPAGDLTRLSTYGIVSENGTDSVVIIDYGLTHDVYKSFYS